MEPDGRTNSLMLCNSCGKAVRGQIKLRMLSGLHEFSCVMGQGRIVSVMFTVYCISCLLVTIYFLSSYFVQ